MRKVLPYVGTCLSILVATWSMQVKAQDSRPFEDVKPDHWAYQAVTDLQVKGIITGYPDHHFDGQRTLTRYEFAVALKRALDRAQIQKGAGGQGTSAPRTETNGAGSPDPSALPGMTALDFNELKRLTADFKSELASLGMGAKDIQSCLDGLAKHVTDSDHRLDQGARVSGDFFLGAPLARSRFSASDYNGASSGNPSSFTNLSTPYDFPLDYHGRLGGAVKVDRQDGFNLNSRFGRSGIRVFGGSFGSVLGNDSAGKRAFGLDTPIVGAWLDMARASAAASPRLYAGSPEYNIGGRAPGQLIGFEFTHPVSAIGELGVTLTDFSLANDGINGSGIGPGSSSIGNIVTYGINGRLSPFGRLAVSGEAAKSVLQRGFDTGDGRNNEDNNAFLLNIAYNSGPLTAAGGYQYYDPQYVASGDWNRIGSWYNPTNVQGPFTRLGYRFSDSLNANLGADYLSGARNRPGYGGFSQGSSVLRGLAGVRYHFSKQFDISAEYEGVLYDMSGAISASGLRAKPVEQYITFGAGLNLTGNTVLRLAYKIINVQDASNGFGLVPGFGGSSSGSTSNASVFTTQVAVHF